jgi:hypothetical protein
MDSSAALANMTNGGGPVHELSALVKWISLILTKHHISAIFRWFPRERLEMKLVDGLSKSVTFYTNPLTIISLQVRWQREIISTDHGKIPDALQAIIGRGLRCVLIAPRWEAKPWWSTLAHFSSFIFPLSHRDIIFVRPEGVQAPSWSFVGAVFN